MPGKRQRKTKPKVFKVSAAAIGRAVAGEAGRAAGTGRTPNPEEEEAMIARIAYHLGWVTGVLTSPYAWVRDWTAGFYSRNEGRLWLLAPVALVMIVWRLAWTPLLVVHGGLYVLWSRMSLEEVVYGDHHR